MTIQNHTSIFASETLHVHYCIRRNVHVTGDQFLFSYILVVQYIKKSRTTYSMRSTN